MFGMMGVASLTTLSLIVFALFFRESGCFLVPEYRAIGRHQNAGKLYSYSSYRNSNAGGDRRVSGNSRRRVRVDNMDFLESTPFSRLSDAQRTALIRGYAERKQLNKALGVLRQMKEHDVMPTTHQFSALLVACRQSNQPDIALGLFDRMINMGVPANTIVYNTLLSALVHNFDDCEKIFHRMDVDKVEKDDYTYSTMMKACGNARKWKVALELYKMAMGSGGQKKTAILNSALTACMLGRVFRIGWDIFRDAYDQGIPRDDVSYSIALQLLANSDNFELALDVFNSMETGILMAKTSEVYDLQDRVSSGNSGETSQAEPFLYPTTDQRFERVPRDDVVVGAMLLVCKEHGKWQEAVDLVDILLCSRRTYDISDQDGHVSTGKFLFSSPLECTVRHMQQAIAACGSVGRIKEAKKLYDQIGESGIKKDAAVFNEMISIFQKRGSQCRLLAERIGERMVAGESTLTAEDSQILADIDESHFEENHDNNAGRVESLPEIQQRLLREAAVHFDKANDFYKEAVSQGLMAEQWTDPTLTRNPLSTGVTRSAVSSQMRAASTELLTSDAGNGKDVSEVPIETLDDGEAGKATNTLKRKRKTIDLHKYPVGVALTAVDSALSEIRETHKKVEGKRAPPMNYDFYVITGRGNHIDSNGNRGVLKKTVEEYLATNYPQLEFLPIPGNDGCVVIRADVLRKWAKAPVPKSRLRKIGVPSVSVSTSVKQVESDNANTSKVSV